LLLDAKDVDINAKTNEGLTAIQLAAGRDHTDIVKLLEAKADVMAKDENGVLL
jgi:ankyrin repeat protein